MDMEFRKSRVAQVEKSWNFQTGEESTAVNPPPPQEQKILGGGGFNWKNPLWGVWIFLEPHTVPWLVEIVFRIWRTISVTWSQKKSEKCR